MAQKAIQARIVSSEQSSVLTENLPYKAIDFEYNLTSLSIFKACRLAGLVAAVVWSSVAFILTT